MSTFTSVSIHLTHVSYFIVSVHNTVRVSVTGSILRAPPSLPSVPSKGIPPPPEKEKNERLSLHTKSHLAMHMEHGPGRRSRATLDQCIHPLTLVEALDQVKTGLFVPADQPQAIVSSGFIFIFVQSPLCATPLSGADTSLMSKTSAEFVASPHCATTENKLSLKLAHRHRRQAASLAGHPQFCLF